MIGYGLLDTKDCPKRGQSRRVLINDPIPEDQKNPIKPLDMVDGFWGC